MTKKEKAAVNKFLLGIVRSKNKVLIPATKFNKKAKPGLMLVVMPLKDILKGWKKLRIALEGKRNGK